MAFFNDLVVEMEQDKMKKYLRRAYIDYVIKVIDVHLNEDDINYHYFINRELRRVRK